MLWKTHDCQHGEASYPKTKGKNKKTPMSSIIWQQFALGAPKPDCNSNHKRPEYERKKTLSHTSGNSIFKDNYTKLAKADELFECVWPFCGIGT